VDNSSPDPAAIAELARIRGTEDPEISVHKAIGWATLNDYEIHVGISLEIADGVGRASHEIRYWEFTKFLHQIGSANELCDSFAQQFILLSPNRQLPASMAPTGEEIAVHVLKKGNGAHPFSGSR
jgi:hypothetical protein